MATAVLSPEATYGCPACGHGVAEIGAVCPGCGATLGLERCVVEVWRGYTTASFIARIGDELVAESPSFRSRGKQAPAETPAAQSALEALTAALLETGWSAAPNDGGPAWFELAFDQLVAIAPDDAAEVEIEEPAEDVPPPPRRQHVRPLPPPLPVEVMPVAVEAPREIAVSSPKPVSAPRGRGGRIVTLVSIVGIGVAGVLGYTIAHRAPAVHTRVITVTQPAPPKQASAPVRKPAAVVPAAPAVSPVHVDVTATRDTWLELRRGSKAGPVVFSGILPTGKHLRVSGRRVWARFAAAGNAEVSVDGKPVALIGTLERLFTGSAR